MIFKWETEKERLLRFMRIPPKKKLEWLYEMNKFMSQFFSKHQGKIRQRLRKVS
jgi:hypothetical protein